MSENTIDKNNKVSGQQANNPSFNGRLETSFTAGNKSEKSIDLRYYPPLLYPCLWLDMEKDFSLSSGKVSLNSEIIGGKLFYLNIGAGLRKEQESGIDKGVNIGGASFGMELNLRDSIITAGLNGQIDLSAGGTRSEIKVPLAYKFNFWDQWHTLTVNPYFSRITMPGSFLEKPLGIDDASKYPEAGKSYSQNAVGLDLILSPMAARGLGVRLGGRWVINQNETLFSRISEYESARPFSGDEYFLSFKYNGLGEAKRADLGVTLSYQPKRDGVKLAFEIPIYGRYNNDPVEGINSGRKIDLTRDETDALYPWNGLKRFGWIPLWFKRPGYLPADKCKEAIRGHQLYVSLSLLGNSPVLGDSGKTTESFNQWVNKMHGIALKDRKLQTNAQEKDLNAWGEYKQKKMEYDAVIEENMKIKKQLDEGWQKVTTLREGVLKKAEEFKTQLAAKIETAGGKDIKFETDKADLTKGGKDQLDRIVDLFMQELQKTNFIIGVDWSIKVGETEYKYQFKTEFPQAILKIQLFGHADPRGPKDKNEAQKRGLPEDNNNLTLSQKRIETVKNYMNEKLKSNASLVSFEIFAEGKGEELPDQNDPLLKIDKESFIGGKVVARNSCATIDELKKKYPEFKSKGYTQEEWNAFSTSRRTEYYFEIDFGPKAVPLEPEKPKAPEVALVAPQMPQKTEIQFDLPKYIDLEGLKNHLGENSQDFYDKLTVAPNTLTREDKDTLLNHAWIKDVGTNTPQGTMKNIVEVNGDICMGDTAYWNLKNELTAEEIKSLIVKYSADELKGMIDQLKKGDITVEKLKEGLPGTEKKAPVSEEKKGSLKTEIIKQAEKKPSVPEEKKGIVASAALKQKIQKALEYLEDKKINNEQELIGSAKKCSKKLIGTEIDLSKEVASKLGDKFIDKINAALGKKEDNQKAAIFKKIRNMEQVKFGDTMRNIIDPKRTYPQDYKLAILRYNYLVINKKYVKSDDIKPEEFTPEIEKQVIINMYPDEKDRPQLEAPVIK